MNIMCHPAIPALAFTALSTGIQYKRSKDNAENQAKYNQQVVDANAKQAQEAFRFNTQQETTRMVQEETSKTTTAQNIDLEKRRATGEALASSDGASLNLEYLLGDFERQKGQQITPLNQQWDWQKQQSKNNLKGYEAQANGRIASVNPAPVSGPSLVGAIAGYGAEAVGIYNQYRNTKGEVKQ